MTGYSWAWTAGTDGKTRKGPVVLVDLSTRDSLAVYRGRVRGAWVLPKPSTPIWNPDAPPPSPEDSQRIAAIKDARAALTADTSAPAVRQRRQYQIDLPYMLREAGALGTLVDGAKEHALMTMSGSPNRVAPLPNIVISHEDYTLMERLIAHRVTPTLEGRVENKLGKSRVQQWNTVGELRGSERPGQVVILGAHLDSWDLGTGVTDNGAGSMVVLEAARVLAKSGLKPKRTIRFILFSGRGGRAARLAAVRGGARGRGGQHAGGPGDRQRYGTDRGTGVAGTAGIRGALAGAPRSGGAARRGLVRDDVKTGTDHLSFIPYGVPGFNFDQEPRGYNHTHHSQSDTYDKAVAEDLRQASAVMAVTAWELANLRELLPRGPKPGPETVPTTPSAMSAK